MTKKGWIVMMIMTLVLALCSFAMSEPQASASHILVESESEADKLAAQLQESNDLPRMFAQLAAEHSKCPSSGSGGALGKFGRGAMVKEFDIVVFEKPKGTVHKVKTQFGWHLVLVTERSGVDEDAINQAYQEAKDL